jgi:hypothetical protein
VKKKKHKKHNTVYTLNFKKHNMNMDRIKEGNPKGKSDKRITESKGRKYCIKNEVEPHQARKKYKITGGESAEDAS